MVFIGPGGLFVELYMALESRHREMAILWTVGAGVGTLATPLLAEDLVLYLVGLSLGVGLAYLSFSVSGTFRNLSIITSTSFLSASSKRDIVRNNSMPSASVQGPLGASPQ